MANWVLGSEMSAGLQAEALRRYVHRHTRDHVPEWAKNMNPDGSVKYPVQFSSDADWLAHTKFAVTVVGRFNASVKYCQSSPTWPDGRGPSTIVLHDAITGGGFGS